MSLFSSPKQKKPALTGGEPGPLVEMLPGVDLASFYAKQTGYTPDPRFFGIYAVEGVGDTLYLGFGTARPAESNGSLLAKTNGSSLVVVTQPCEQGFVGMRHAGDTLYVPGPDPMEDWTLGNVYIGRQGEEIVKRRNLRNVVHTWGIYPDTLDAKLYAAVGRHAGDNQSFLGGVLISDDDGESWSVSRDPKRALGKYRTYDITRFNDTLYATANDEYALPSALASSSNGGEWWRRVDVQIESRPRLVVTSQYLVAQLWGRAGFQLVDADGRLHRTKFPGFRASDWSYNYLCAGYGGWYYLLADGGRIYISRDLRAWKLAAQTGLDLLAVGFWQSRNWLIVTDRGAGAGLWRLDLAQYGAI